MERPGPSRLEKLVRLICLVILSWVIVLIAIRLIDKIVNPS